MGYILKFTNTVSPPPYPQMSHFGGDGKKNFGANAPTSSSPNLGPSLRQCRQHIIGLYGTPAVRQAVLRLAWYTRYTADSIRDSIRTKKIRFAGP